MEFLPELPDVAGRVEALCEDSFGPGRSARTAERLREGNALWRDVSRIAVDATGNVIAAARIWPLVLSRVRGVILVGPVAVAAHRRGEGFGARVASSALDAAAAAGARWAVLIGDMSYFGQIGFVPASEDLIVPGPVEKGRLLCRPLCGQRTSLAGVLSVPRRARRASSRPGQEQRR